MELGYPPQHTYTFVFIVCDRILACPVIPFAGQGNGDYQADGGSDTGLATNSSRPHGRAMPLTCRQSQCALPAEVLGAANYFGSSLGREADRLSWRAIKQRFYGFRAGI